MGSRSRSVTTTRKRALKKVENHLDRLSTRQANLIRMRHGLDVDPDRPVGDPPAGCDEETVEQARLVEARVLGRASQRRPYRSPATVKEKKIIDSLKKKS